MDTSPCFSAIFAKENNICHFLSASLVSEALSNWGLLLKESKNENDRVASSETLPIHAEIHHKPKLKRNP